MAPHSRSGSQVFLQCTTSQPISFLCRSNLRLRPSRSTPKFLCHLTSMIGCRSTSRLRRPFPNIALSIHTSHLSAICLSTLPSALRCFMPPASLSNCLLIPSFQLCCTAPLISNVALHHLFLSINSRFLMLCSHIRYAAYWVCQGCILTGVWVTLALRSIRVYNIDIDALVQQLLEAARGHQRQQIKQIRVGALQFLSALLRLNENENGWAAAGLQKSANGDELSLLIAAIHELLVYIGCGGQTRADCDVHGIVHNRINDFQRFLGHCSAKQCFLKRGAGAGEHMQGDVRESGSEVREARVGHTMASSCSTKLQGDERLAIGGAAASDYWHG